MNPFVWVWHYIRPYWLHIFGGLFLVLFVSFLSMANPYLAGIIVDDVIFGGKESILTLILAVMIGATVIRSLTRYLFQLIFEHVSQNVIFGVRHDIYSKMQQLDFEFFDKTRTGDIMSRMTRDSEAIRHFVAGIIYIIIENVAVFIFALYMMFSVNAELALFMLAVTPITGFFAFKMAKAVHPTFVAIREQFSKLNSVVQENISGNRVIKAFAKEDYEVYKFTNENEGFKKVSLESAKVWEDYLPIIDSTSGLLSVIMIMAGGWMVIDGRLTLGELVMFNGFIWAINNPMRMVGWHVNAVQNFTASASKIIDFLNTKPKIVNENSNQKLSKSSFEGYIEFKDVSFSYNDEKVLRDINFKVKPGQTVAVIGPTGSGKSSLVNLICRFYDPDSGAILIDGVNIKNIDIKKIRENISSAMQDIFLFSDTIEGNIAYGVPDASMEQVKKVADIADADKFIENFPEGYDTIVGERGVGLSGGQKQRIALARALISDPSILILDDTTSSVDMETEHEIYKTLKYYYKDKTIFIIAHRISSVKDANLIVVLNNGVIEEMGNHEQLLDNKGYYYNVFINQFGDFNVENNVLEAIKRGN